MSRIKMLWYWLLAWPALLAFALMRGERKQRLVADLKRFYMRRTGRIVASPLRAFYEMMVTRREFRSVFYMRMGHASVFIKWLLPGMPTLDFGVPSSAIEGGLFIEHGWAMVIDAENVGRNLWINQGVTIGWGRGGHPTIGDDVRIGTDAVILGGIRIGNNVNIGAGAIVVEDVPDNVTVCSPKAQIVRHHDGPTMNAQLMGGVNG